MSRYILSTSGVMLTTVRESETYAQAIVRRIREGRNCNNLALQNMDLTGLDLSEVYTHRLPFDFYGSNFNGAILDGVKLHGHMARCTFLYASMRGTIVAARDLCSSLFINVSFQDADLRGGNFTSASFRACDFTGARVSRQALRHASIGSDCIGYAPLAPEWQLEGI